MWSTKVEITGLAAPSVDRDESEPMLGGNLHRSFNAIDCRQGHSVGPNEREEPFAIPQA
jgi:hypothetical protein